MHFIRLHLLFSLDIKGGFTRGKCCCHPSAVWLVVVCFFVIIGSIFLYFMHVQGLAFCSLVAIVCLLLLSIFWSIDASITEVRKLYHCSKEGQLFSMKMPKFPIFPRMYQKSILPCKPISSNLKYIIWFEVNVFFLHVIGVKSFIWFIKYNMNIHTRKLLPV